MAGRFSVEAVFKAVDKITAPVSRMQNRVQRMTRTMSRGFKSLNRTVNKVSAGIKKGLMASTVALGLFGAAFANITNAGSEFGRAIGSAAAKFPDKIERGTDAFRALEKTARDVGATTEFTSVQAAQGLNFLAKAGWDANFSMKALRPIVDFATASEIEFAEAADIASDAIGAFGMDVKDPIQKLKNLNRVMDVMSKTANSSNTSVSQMFEAVTKGAPVAIQAGQSIETFSAVIGTLAGVGIKATDAGTATKNLANALAGVGNKAKKTFDKLNIPLSVGKEMRDIADVFEDLTKKTDKLGKAEKLQIMNAIFGKIPIAAAMNLLGEGANKVRELRKTLEQAGGSSKATAAFIRDDVKGSLDSMNSAIESVKISIFSLNEGPLKETIDKVTQWVRVNEKLISTKIGDFLLKIFNNLDVIWKWLKRIGMGIAVFYALATAIKAVNTVLMLTNLIAAANPFVLIVLGVVALIAAIAAIIIWWDKLNKWIKIIFIGFGILSGPIGWLILAAGAIIHHWNPVKKFFISIWETIKKVTGFVGKGTFGLFKNFKNNLFGKDATNSRQINQMISPQERTARSIEETRTTSTSEVTIKDDTGRAQVTKGKLGPGLFLQPSGAF